MKISKSGWLILGACVVVLAIMYVALYTGQEDTSQGEEPRGLAGQDGVRQAAAQSAQSPAAPPEKPAKEAAPRPEEPPVTYYLENLPRPVPDIVAMIRAEKPVEVGTPYDEQYKKTMAAFHAIRLRQQQGDQEGALRLYKELADKYPGTSGAATALFEVARSPVRRYNDTWLSAEQIAQIGEIALTLAKENPTHHLTVRTLYMYLRESLDAVGKKSYGEFYGGPVETVVPPSQRYRPSQEDWQRIFQAAAILAGRYPGDTRGAGCLLELTHLLTRMPRAKQRAIEIYRLLCEWPGAWYENFVAYKALHDDAVEQGDLTKAREIALKAANQCAGKLSHAHYRKLAKESRGQKPDTPWHKMLDSGVPSEAKILLEAPRWKPGDWLAFTVKGFHFDKSAKKWGTVRFGSSGKEERHALYLLRREPNGLCSALVSHNLHGARSAFEAYSIGPCRFAFLGNPKTACPAVISLLFLPKFPVREGVEVLSFDRIGLVRQEAHLEGGKIVIKIHADGGTVYQQTWTRGEPWWEAADLEYDSREMHSRVPGAYDVDPGWGRTRSKIQAARVEATDQASFPTAKELEKKALAEMSSWSVNEEIAKLILARLPEVFSGEELKKLQRNWDLRFNPRKWSPMAAEAEKLQHVKSLLAEGDSQAALKKLEEGEPWRRQFEALALKGEALLALGKPLEAAQILRHMPRRGPFASARVHLLEAEAWEACRKRELALWTALELLRDCPQSPEAAQAKKIVGRLKPDYAERLQKQHTENPYAAFRTRSLWRPANRTPWDVSVEQCDKGANILVWGSAGGLWFITPDGEELELPKSPKPGKRLKSNRHGTAGMEFARKGETAFVKEADRIVARKTSGEEFWRFTVPARQYGSGRGYPKGLPVLAGPHLVKCPEGERIVCGVGQRTVQIGMGIRYGPAGGGLLALDTKGKVVYEKEVTYCDSLTVVPRKGKTPIAVGLFFKPSRPGNCWDAKGKWFLAAFDASTGSGLWEKPIAYTAKRFRTSRTNRLFTAANAPNSYRIVLSLGGIRVFDVEGKQLMHIGAPEVELLVDFDSDGVDEIVACRKVDYYAGGALSILALDGCTLWEGPPGRWVARAAEDLDGDGWKELIAIREYRLRAVAVFGRLPADH